MSIAAVIFMGGEARRLNGIDKANIKIGNVSCLNRILAVIEPHVNQIGLSLARKRQQTENLPAYPLIYDVEIQGELMGLPSAFLAVIEWAMRNNFDHLITSSVDTPFLPVSFVNDLVQTYQSIGNKALPIVSQSNNVVHGLHALWPATALEEVKRLIELEHIFKISTIHEILNSKSCRFDSHRYDPFLNINSNNDLSIASSVTMT